MRAYAIGDIHGHLEKLRHAHALIAADRARQNDDTAPVVHIGDLVDRGPDSCGVITLLMAGQARGEPWVVLKGNHDKAMGLFLQQPSQRDPKMRAGLTWLHPRIGGGASLESYGVDVSPAQPSGAIHTSARALVPQAHRDFLRNLPLSFRAGDLFFCHAGVRPGVALDAQAEVDLIWIREEFHQSNADHGALVIHGHTPVDVATHYGNRVNIDTGAGFERALSAVVIEGRDVWLLTDTGRTALHRV